jgi:hypothetical protein
MLPTPDAAIPWSTLVVARYYNILSLRFVLVVVE